MRKAFDIFIFIVFTLAAIYLGGYLMFVGGIVQMIESTKADPMNILQFVLGLLRFIFSGTVAYTIYLVGMLISGSYYTFEKNKGL